MSASRRYRRELRRIHEGLLLWLLVSVAGMVVAIAWESPEGLVAAGTCALIMCRGIAECREERAALQPRRVNRYELFREAWTPGAVYVAEIERSSYAEVVFAAAGGLSEEDEYAIEQLLAR